VNQSIRHPRFISETRPSSWNRPAFTLLELMLALGILITLATLSWPGLMRSLKQQGVQGNAEQVRQVLDQARVRAVEEGRILQLRFEPNGTHYALLPLDPVNESQTTAATASTTTHFQKEPVQSDPFRIYELTQGCYFHVDSSLLSGEKTTSERLGDEWLGHLENSSIGRDLAWSLPILYSPDGSATDGSLVVMDKDRQYIKLHIRGLTGANWSEPLAVMTERLGKTSP